MDKKQHTHFWRDLIAVSPAIFLLIAAASGVIAVGALRANNLKMIELRQNVYTADQNGKDIEAALKALREQVYNHMNTNLTSGPNAVHPPIQLKYTYDRLVQAQQIKEKAGQDAASAANATIYSSAQKYCEAKIPDGFSGRYRLDCIAQYVKDHPANTQAVVGQNSVDIPKNLYEFDFVSPRWSPDLAGWSLLVAAVSAFMALAIWLGHIIRRLLHKDQPAAETAAAAATAATVAHQPAHPKIQKKAANQHPVTPVKATKHK